MRGLVGVLIWRHRTREYIYDTGMFDRSFGIARREAQTDLRHDPGHIIAVLIFRGNAAMVMYGRRRQRPACTTLRWSCDGCLKTEVGVEDSERCSIGENRASMTQIFSSGDIERYSLILPI